MGRLAKKSQVDQDCLSLTLERMEYLFDTFDNVVISFSGGKDSTPCLNTALEVAAYKKRLPLRVVTFDEEAIPPETVEYCQRVSERDDVVFEWYCIPIEHRNACSTRQPYWYCWAPEDKHLWCRDLPPTAITEQLGPIRAGIPDYQQYLCSPANGSVAMVLGIRAQESLTRLGSILSRRGKYAWIVNPEAGKSSYIRKAYPIYDWTTEDVWLAPEIKQWDYNRAYDVMTLAGIPLSMQRCCPPYGEQPLRGLYKFKSCWPELWAKMVNRVHGAATAARYANTDLYGCGIKDTDKSPDKTWRETVFETIAKLTPESRKEVAESIKGCMNAHKSYTDDELPDEVPHEMSGYCWKLVYTVAKVGGDKFSRQSQKMNHKAIAARRKTNAQNVKKGGLQ